MPPAPASPSREARGRTDDQTADRRVGSRIRPTSSERGDVYAPIRPWKIPRFTPRMYFPYVLSPVSARKYIAQNPMDSTRNVPYVLSCTFDPPFAHMRARARVKMLRKYI